MQKIQTYWVTAVRWFLLVFVIDDVFKATTLPYRYLSGSVYNFWSTGVGVLSILLTLSGVFLFVFKQNKRKQELFRLFALSSLCVISIITFVMTLDFGWMNNVRALSWLLFFFVVVSDSFGLDTTRDKKKFNSQLQWVISLTWTSVTLYSLSTIFFPVAAIYNVESIIIPQGQMGGRLYGFFNDPNYAALYTSLVVLLTIWMISQTKSISAKLYLYFSLLVLVSFSIVAESRSGSIALAAGLGWLVSYKLLKSISPTKYLLRLSLSFLTLITAVGISLLAQVVDFSVTQNTEVTSSQIDSNDIGGARGYGTGNDFSNGRVAIWKEYSQLPPEAYIIGYSPGNLLEKIQTERPNLHISKQPTVAHNTAIYALVSVGALGFLLIIYLIGSFLSNAWKAFKLSYGWEQAVSLSVIFSTFIGVMFLNDILFVNTVGAFIAFYALRSFSANVQNIKDS